MQNTSEPKASKAKTGLQIKSAHIINLLIQAPLLKAALLSIVLLSTVDFNGCVFVKITSRLTEPAIAIRSLQTFFYLPDIAQHSQAVPDDMYF